MFGIFKSRVFGLVLLLGLGSNITALAHNFKVRASGRDLTLYADVTVKLYSMGSTDRRIFYSFDGGATKNYHSTVVDWSDSVTFTTTISQIKNFDLGDTPVGESKNVSGGGNFVVYLMTGQSTNFNQANVFKEVSIPAPIGGTVLHHGENFDYTTIASSPFTVSFSQGDLPDGVVPHDYSDPNYVPPEPVEPPEEVPDAEFYALGYEPSDELKAIAAATPSETMDMLIEAAGTSGSGITKEVLIAEVAALGANPKIVLEGVELANGDKITFKHPSVPDVEGFIQTGSDGKLLWTDDNTRVITSVTAPAPPKKDTGEPTSGGGSSGGSSGGTVNTTVVTSTVNNNGSTIISTVTITGDGTSTTSGESKEGEDEDGTMTGAEEQAGAAAAAAAGESEGQAEGEAVFGDASDDASASLAEASQKLSSATGQLETKMVNYNPFGNTTFGTVGSVSHPVDFGPVQANFTMPFNHVGFQIARAIELFVMSLFAIRMFFKILII